MEDIKKTSKQWYEELNTKEKSEGTHLTVIMDPDGWDRKNYEYSFNEELVTEMEFTIRKGMSTVLCYPIKESSK